MAPVCFPLVKETLISPEFHLSFAFSLNLTCLFSSHQPGKPSATEIDSNNSNQQDEGASCAAHTFL